MRIKRYLVNNMPEAMEVIKRDLGPEAVIISHRWVREKGLWGFFLPRKLEVTAAVEQSSPETATAQQNLAEEVAELKAMLKQAVLAPQKQGSAPPPESDLLLKWRQTLEELEVNHEVIGELLGNIKGDLGPWTPEKEELVKETVERRMASIFESASDNTPNSGIYVFVGPTGVGKTTTLAKLAAHLALFEEKNIALLTIDTYRIGAVEQLKTYGEILDVPVEAVLTPEELAEAVHRHRDKDVILIDTAGRPSSDKKMMAELQAFLSKIEPAEIFLVMSCTTKCKDLLRIAEDFKVLNYNRLIFTKTDETMSLGSIVNLVRATSKPVAYVTTGQSVPDDIEACNPRKLVKLILGAMG